MVFDADGVFDKRVNRLDSKVSQEVEQRIYADSSLNERINKIKYYGDADIEISPDEWFVFNDEEHTILGGFSEGHENETSIVIPYSVTIVGEGAFTHCESLTNVIIPNSVTSISSSAFSYCYSLTSITILDSVTSIGKDAFAGCTNLTIYCEQGSCADTFAKENNIPVKYTDIYIDKTVTANSENAVSSRAVFEAVSEAVSIAQSDSLQAISTSESANTTAQQAIANADNAVEIADQALFRSENADYTSRQAEGNARTALNLSKQAAETASKANTLADSAKEIAQSVRADADSGKFDGEKGEKGDKGDKGEQGIQGIQGEKGDDGKDGADYIITEADKEEIKSDVVETLTRSSTALPEMLDVNTIYDLGEQDALILNLPAGKLGDFIEVDFLSTQTPTTLTITASAGMSDYELIPDANTIYSLYFNWIRLDVENYGWGFGYAEYTRTVTE